MSAENEVHKASDQFYAAMNRLLNGDADSMESIWSHNSSVTILQPIGGRTVGWDNVRESYQDVAQIAEEGHVKLDDQIIQVTGDFAYEVGVERGQAIFAGYQVTLDYRVTNIYCCEADNWKIVHHHTDVSPAMLEVLNQT
jgi:ketosteroid isomerase-like protein